MSDIELEFSYTDNANASGWCKNKKLFISCNNLNSSTVRHEYFHAMDIALNNNLNINQEIKITFSQSRPQNINLTEFSQFLEYYDTNTSSSIDTKKDLILYFKRFFSQEFNLLSFPDIKESHLIYEFEEFAHGIYSNGKGHNKYNERDDLIKELDTHIKYAIDNKSQPKRTLYAVFSQILDLGIDTPYFSFEPEKLARIYQSQYHSIEEDSNDKIKKMLPLGTDKKLVTQLNHIIQKEFSVELSKKPLNEIKNVIGEMRNYYISEKKMNISKIN